jgi:adenylate cyclase
MVAFGFVYAFAFRGGDPHIILDAVIVALIVGVFSSVAELYLFQAGGRRWRFWVLLVVRSSFYVVLISVAVISTITLHFPDWKSLTLDHFFRSRELHSFLTGGEFTRILVYAVLGTLAINFMRQVNVLFGQNALLYFFTSRYQSPVEEERVFMFLDLKSSTRIAETLGHTNYCRFLNDFFHDITPAILESKGEVYQYVGDEVVVTWPARQGVKDGNCITCYFRARASIDLALARYQERYRMVPGFKVGYHIGPVMVAEIGEVRKQIAFHGDTVNTAARIRSECTVLGKDLLLSGALRSRLVTGDLFTFDSVGEIRLVGKADPMELFTVREAA